jgi:hypothetical protein
MSQLQVPAPSVKLTSFACPHCGAHATQHWFNTLLTRISGSTDIPSIPTVEVIERIEKEARTSRDEKDRAVLVNISKQFSRLLLGEPFIGKSENTAYNPPSLENVFVSHCYTCSKPAIWLHDRLIYPPTITGPSPNLDLSDDVQRDFEEARRILDQSPRGAAALLRLAVEKICIDLGAQGANIDQRIASLVSKGLPVEVQQALDAVRVIGNEAVHPGQVDIRDDRDTASKLFELVNFIAYDRISRPKKIAGVYKMIPDNKREAIEVRNLKATNSKLA